jgi:acyl dehydratase
MTKDIYFEDFEIGSVREGGSRTMTETDFVVHAGHTGDFYPHHVDAEFAKTTEFGQRIAHGTMIFSIGMGLQCGDINPKAFTYGYDRLRFIKPVFIGDTISVSVTIKEKRDSPKHPDRGFVVEAISITKQNGDLAMVCEHIISVERRNK